MSISLPCTCGRRVRVTTGQAGLTIACECGRALEVPSLRELRALPTDEPEPGRTWSAPFSAVLAGGIWAVIGGWVVVWSLLEYASIPPFLREKDSAYLGVSLFGGGLVLVGWQTFRGRMRVNLLLGLISLAVGALILAGLVAAQGELVSPVSGSGLGLVSAGLLTMRARKRYRSRARNPVVRTLAPGYQEAGHLVLPPWNPGDGTRKWTSVLQLPGRTGSSRPLRFLMAALIYPLGVALGLAVVGLWSWSYKARDREPGKHTSQAMTVAFVAVVLGAHRTARRILARRARELDPQDTRAPILLLRAFTDDQREVGQTDGAIGPWRRSVTLEEILTEQLARLGPVIAIGRPGELLTPIGAARLWLDNSAWQDGVHILLDECQYVVMVMGRTHNKEGKKVGLAWEVEQIHERDLLSKLILVMPPVSEHEAEKRWDGFRALLGAQMPPYAPFTCFARRSSSIWKVVRSLGGTRQPSDYREKIT
jgi:hypothetical protein